MTDTTKARRSSLRRRLPRLLAIVAVALLLALLTYGVFSKGTSRVVDDKLAKGIAPPAPPFDLAVLEPGTVPRPLASRVSPLLADSKLSLAELRGIPVVLNFWASWCSPCREEAPRLASGWLHWGPRGVLFLGLNMEDLTGDAHDFIQKFHMTYPSIRDPGRGIANSYGATGIPETFFITAQGHVVDHVIGVVSDEQLETGASAALRGRVVGTSLGGEQRPSR